MSHALAHAASGSSFPFSLQSSPSKEASCSPPSKSNILVTSPSHSTQPRETVNRLLMTRNDFHMVTGALLLFASLSNQLLELSPVAIEHPEVSNILLETALCRSNYALLIHCSLLWLFISHVEESYVRAFDGRSALLGAVGVELFATMLNAGAWTYLCISTFQESDTHRIFTDPVLFPVFLYSSYAATLLFIANAFYLSFHIILDLVRTDKRIGMELFAMSVEEYAFARRRITLPDEEEGDGEKC